MRGFVGGEADNAESAQVFIGCQQRGLSCVQLGRTMPDG